MSLKEAHLLLQLVLPVVDGDGVVVPVQTVDQSLKEPEQRDSSRNIS